MDLAVVQTEDTLSGNIGRSHGNADRKLEYIALSYAAFALNYLNSRHDGQQVGRGDLPCACEGPASLPTLIYIHSKMICNWKTFKVFGFAK